MNALSWMIYAADTIPAVGTGLGFFGGVSLVTGSVMTVIGWTPWTRYSWDRDETAWNEKMTIKARVGRYGPRLVTLGAAMVIACALTPSQRTIYLIAASQAGEQIVTSPDAVEMMGDLKAIIKKRLKAELGAN